MLKKHPIELYLFWLIALVIFPGPLVLILNQGLVAPNDQILLIDSGVVAYSWWLLEVLLSTRSQWLDRLIGLPALYFMHGALGIGALALAFVHRHYLMSMGRWIRLTGNLAWYLIVFGIIYAAFFMSGWFVDRFPLAAKIKRRVQFFLTHQVSIWLHRLNLVAILLIWLHVHLIGRVSVLSTFMILFDGYTIATFGCYLAKKILSPSDQLIGRVISNDEIATGVRRISMRFNKHQLKFNAGDFFFFKFTAISNEAHPFSLENGDQKSGLITIVTRAVGDYTRQLAQLPINTAVHIEGPFGRFAKVIDESPQKKLVLIGMGTGIAPLVSLSSAYHDERRIHVIWTVKDRVMPVLDDQLRQLEGTSFQYHSQTGRLTDALFLIVGSAPAVISVESMLHRAGVARKNLIDERLTM